MVIRIANHLKPPLKGVTTLEGVTNSFSLKGKSGSGRRQDSKKATRGVRPKPAAHLRDPLIQG